MEQSLDECEINIPKWALPTEIIPIIVTWPSELKWTKLEVILPDDIRIVDVSNAAKFEIVTENNSIVITEIFKSSMKHQKLSFVAIEVCASKCDELQKQYKALINLNNNDKVIYEKIGSIRIFRPFIEIIPIEGSEIILKNTIDKAKIPFILKISGFGDMFYKINLKTKGLVHFAPHLASGNLVLYFLQYLSEDLNCQDNDLSASTDFEETNPDELDNAESSNQSNMLSKISDEQHFQMEDSFNTKLLNQIKSVLEDPSSFKFDDCTEDELIELIENAKKVESELFLRMNDFLTELIVETRDRFPSEVLETDATEITIKNPEILTSIRNLGIQVEYWDAMENAYHSNSINIPIRDIRDDKSKFPTLRLSPDDIKKEQISGVENYTF